jgi:hypothetical protein
MSLQESIWYAEYRVRKHRGSHGKVVRRSYPAATAAQVQDLAAYFAGDYSVQVSTDPIVWQEAYDCIRSCMIGKGALCARAYTPHGVSIAVLRDSAGTACARMLVRNGQALTAYGALSHLLVAALTMLGGVVLAEAWIDGCDVSAPLRNQVKSSFLVDVYKTTRTDHTGVYRCGYSTYKHQYTDNKRVYIRGTGSFRPWVDGLSGNVL